MIVFVLEYIVLNAERGKGGKMGIFKFWESMTERFNNNSDGQERFVIESDSKLLKKIKL